MTTYEPRGWRVYERSTGRATPPDGHYARVEDATDQVRERQFTARLTYLDRWRDAARAVDYSAAAYWLAQVRRVDEALAAPVEVRLLVDGSPAAR